MASLYEAITASRFSFSGSVCLIGLVYIALKLYDYIRTRVKTTALRGPPPVSFLLGNLRDERGDAESELVEGWASQYGSVLAVPAALGSRIIYLTDPKAVAHFYAQDAFTYVKPKFDQMFFELLVGRGLLSSEGESHKRQRKTLAPAFNNQAIRTITPVFYDSAYKVKNAWDALFDTAGTASTIIDVQSWMNRVSLDSIGIAGFAHDFGSLDGKQSDIADVFARFAEPGKQPNPWTFILAPILPLLIKLPSAHNTLIKKLHNSAAAVAAELLQQSRAEVVGSGAKSEKGYSIIGAVVKAEASDTELRLSEEEALTQMKVVILAGYETTSISLTWALLDLARDQERQQKLRDELSSFGSADPTWDQLTNSLPYLDAVVRECFRLHPPVQNTDRVAVKDDIIPLQNPITTASGEVVDRIYVARGTAVTVPIRTINCSTEIWGPDAKEFNPERWLYPDEDGVPGSRGLPKKAHDIQGWRHLLTFVDGPRTCLGRGFAVAEFKAVFSVLIRNYKFELREEKETEVELVASVLPRPRVVGEEGLSVPLKVTRIE